MGSHHILVPKMQQKVSCHVAKFYTQLLHSLFIGCENYCNYRDPDLFLMKWLCQIHIISQMRLLIVLGDIEGRLSFSKQKPYDSVSWVFDLFG